VTPGRARPGLTRALAIFHEGTSPAPHAAAVNFT
jgi:hypothetical protein